MGINFPASPIVGQKYPQPAVAGIPVYTWDGEKWTTVGGSIAAYAPPADAVPLMDATPGLVGTTTEYAREDHVHPTDTSRASAAAVGEVFGSAMAYSGMQINGGMTVSQENGTTQLGVQDASRYITDGWALTSFGAQVVTGYQTGPPPPLAGHGSSMEFFVAAANASPTGVDQATFEQKIEGIRVSRLAWGTASASPVTIGFWVKAVRTGLYCGSVRNGAVNRTYVFTFTVTATATWEYKTVTMPGDTTGTWDQYNTTGFILNFTPMAGPTLITTPNVWTAGNFLAAPGAVNGVAATTDKFSITGVTILPGTQAPTAAQSPFIMRPYDQELVTCQRYFTRTYTVWNGSVNSGQTLVSEMVYFHPMRVVPAAVITIANPVNLGSPGMVPYHPTSAELRYSTYAPGDAAFEVACNFDARL